MRRDERETMKNRPRQTERLYRANLPPREYTLIRICKNKRKKTVKEKSRSCAKLDAQSVTVKYGRLALIFRRETVIYSQ